jgi:hypothetical protein
MKKKMNFLFLFLVAWVCPSIGDVEVKPITESEIQAIRIGSSQETTRITFDINGSFTHKIVKLENPDRFVLDIFNLQKKPDTTNIDLTKSPISKVRTSLRNANTVRIVFDLKNKVDHEDFILQGTDQPTRRLVIDLKNNLKSVLAPTPNLVLEKKPTKQTNEKDVLEIKSQNFTDSLDEANNKIVISREQAAREQAAREQAAKAQAAREQAAKEQAAKELAAKAQAAREQAAKEQAAKEQAAREQAAKEQAAREQAARELAAKELAAKELAAKELAAKELAAKELAAKEQVAREQEAKQNALKTLAKPENDKEELTRIIPKSSDLYSKKSSKKDIFKIAFGSGISSDETCGVSFGLEYTAGIQLTNKISTHISYLEMPCNPEGASESVDQSFDEYTLRYTSPLTGAFFEYGSSDYNFGDYYSSKSDVYGFGYTYNQNDYFSEIKFKVYPEDYESIVYVGAIFGLSF